MTKDEAARELGVSTRAINRYVERGRLHVTVIENRGDGRSEARYDAGEVASLKAQMEREREQEKASPPVTPDTVTALQRNYGGKVSGEKVELARALADALAPRPEQGVKLHRKLCLTRSEAAEYSGLGVGTIEHAVASGMLKALPGGARGAVIIRRVDLERYVAELFDRQESRPERAVRPDKRVR